MCLCFSSPVSVSVLFFFCLPVVLSFNCLDFEVPSFFFSKVYPSALEMRKKAGDIVNGKELPKADTDQWTTRFAGASGNRKGSP